MIAIVTIDLSNRPDKEYRDDMRRTAAELTDDRKSIRIKAYGYKDFHRLEVRFAMRTVAYCKVVGRIFHDFEYASCNCDDFLDISVSFQK